MIDRDFVRIYNSSKARVTALALRKLLALILPAMHINPKERIMSNLAVISIERVENYNCKHKFLNGLPCLVVKAPYDGELVGLIKGLDWQQREWMGKNG